MPRDTIYDTRKPLHACEHKSLNRQIGLLIQEPIFHVGMDQVTVDVEYETITVNTQSYGAVEPVENWELRAVLINKKVLRDLAQVINELQLHRHRMQEHLEGLQVHALGPSLSLLTPRTNGVRNAIKAAVLAAVAIKDKTKEILQRKENL